MKISWPRIIKVGLVLFAMVSTQIVFQNCGGFGSGYKSSSSSSKLSGGEGYGGKVTYVNRGDCDDDQVIDDLSVIEVLEDGTKRLLRENCENLEVPKIINESSIKKSEFDPSLFLNAKDIFDQTKSTNSQYKLSTAFCYAEDPEKKLEVTVWYNSETLEDYPDPRIAETLYGRVVVSATEKTEILEIGRPEVLEDRLIYRSKTDSSEFVLNQTREGHQSSISYKLNGTTNLVPLVCRSQIAPISLAPFTQYILNLPATFPDQGNGYAILKHMETDDIGVNLFKTGGSSAPEEWPSVGAGWNYGYVSLREKLYEMRNLSGGRLCLADASAPEKPCRIGVLGTVDGNEFFGVLRDDGLFAQNASFLTKTKIPVADAELESKYRLDCGGVVAPFPAHINWRNFGSQLRKTSEYLYYENFKDPGSYPSLLTAYANAIPTFLSVLPPDLFKTPHQVCYGTDLLTAELTLKGMIEANNYAPNIALANFVKSQKPNIQREVNIAKDPLQSLYSRSDKARLVSLALMVASVDPIDFDYSFALSEVENIVKSQVVTEIDSTSFCPGANLIYGGYMVKENGSCGQPRAYELAQALIDFRSFLRRNEKCTSAVFSNLENACEAIGKSLVRYLVFRYKTVNLDLESTPFGKVLRQDALDGLPEIFSFLASTPKMKMNRSTNVQFNFSTDSQITFEKIRSQLVRPKGSLTSSGSSAREMIDWRIADLLNEPQPIPDLIRPVVEITEPLEGVTLVGGSSVVIKASVFDNRGVAKVEFSIWPGKTILCKDIEAPYECTWVVPAGVLTSYDVQVRATDTSGNLEMKSVTVSVD